MKAERVPAERPRRFAMPELQLHADCRRCAALCCVATHFDASEDFALTKPAGVPCPHLAEYGHQCTIHAERLTLGFAGCLAYDCHGAGQWVTAHYGDDATRHEAFLRLRPLFRRLWMARGALEYFERAGLPHARLEPLRAEVLRLCAELEAGALAAVPSIECDAARIIDRVRALASSVAAWERR